MTLPAVRPAHGEGVPIIHEGTWQAITLLDHPAAMVRVNFRQHEGRIVHDIDGLESYWGPLADLMDMEDEIGQTVLDAMHGTPLSDAELAWAEHEILGIIARAALTGKFVPVPYMTWPHADREVSAPGTLHPKPACPLNDDMATCASSDRKENDIPMDDTPNRVGPMGLDLGDRKVSKVLFKEIHLPHVPGAQHPLALKVIVEFGPQGPGAQVGGLEGFMPANPEVSEDIQAGLVSLGEVWRSEAIDADTAAKVRDDVAEFVASFLRDGRLVVRPGVDDPTDTATRIEFLRDSGLDENGTTARNIQGDLEANMLRLVKAKRRRALAGKLARLTVMAADLFAGPLLGMLYAELVVGLVARLGGWPILAAGLAAMWMHPTQADFTAALALVGFGAGFIRRTWKVVA